MSLPVVLCTVVGEAAVLSTPTLHDDRHSPPLYLTFRDTNIYTIKLDPIYCYLHSRQNKKKVGEKSSCSLWFSVMAPSDCAEIVADLISVDADSW